MAGPDGGWEDITDPSDVPGDIRKSLGVAGVRKALGIDAVGGSGGKPPTEAERKAAFLATRVAGGIGQLYQIGRDAAKAQGAKNPTRDEIETALTENASPGLFESGVRSVFGDTAANYITGADRQRAEAAQSDILDAALTLGTGAAYTREQIEGYRRSYFPQLGDDITTIADKRQRLDLLLRSARVGAGSAAPQIDDALKAAGFAVDQQEGGDPSSGAAGAGVGSVTPPPGPAPGDQLAFADELPAVSATVSELTPEQEADLRAFTATKPTPAQIKARYASYGTGAEITDENAQALADYYAKGGTGFGVSYEKVGVAPVDAGDGAAGAAARGAGNALTLGTLDEVGALSDVVTQGGTYAENLDRRRGMELFDEQENAGPRLAGQIIGGFPVGGIQFAGARAAARAAGVSAMRQGLGREAASRAYNLTYAQRVAAESATIGGAYGFGDTEGNLGERAVGAGIGAAFGGAAGGALTYAGGRFAQRLAARTGRPLTDGQESLAAAERQGIVPFPADVGGGIVRRATGATAQLIGGVVPIRRGAQATLDSAEAVRNRVASAIGQPANPELAGETAAQGARAFIARTGQRIGRIYDAAAAAGGTARVDAAEAVRVLDQELVPLRESPIQGPGVAILEGLRDALNRPQTVRGLREARTQLRDQFESAGLRGSNVERIASRVVDAATDDLVSGLRAQGLDRAATQYRIADRMWRQRAETIDETLDPIIGGEKSGEQVLKSLQSAMQGNNRRFAAFIQALPPEEQGAVRASLIQRLGRATKSNQDESGEVFSLATFLTHWDGIGERAKNTLFGADGRAALNDLARYAAQSRESQRFANFSNTGAAVTTSALGASVAAGPVGVIAAAKVLALQYGAGRLLASPRFARWLARPPRNVSPTATRAYVERLTRIARAEPAIANDVLALQQRLTEALGSAPARLAADERGDHAGIADRGQRDRNRQGQGLQP